MNPGEDAQIFNNLLNEIRLQDEILLHVIDSNSDVISPS
jgi:hypothetical protein